MNIFYLHSDPKICAQYHCDKHVVKMILESAQLLCTAHHILGTDQTGLYRPTHVNHPCAVWVRESSENYMYVYNLFKELLEEWRFRFNHLEDGRFHASSRLLEPLLNLPKGIKIGKLTTPPACMPDECITEGNPIESYRYYYIYVKSDICRWDWNREIPKWYKLKEWRFDI